MSRSSPSRLITGRSRLGISALTPRMLTLGLVLTFATSWIAYQGMVWNLAVGAPDEIAGLLMGTGFLGGSATQIFADKIDIVFEALGQMNDQPMPAAQRRSRRRADVDGRDPAAARHGGPARHLQIALAVLLALGPVFVVLALFRGTRGLFTGWLKGVVLLAIAPLFAVLGGSLMLELAVPVINTLTQSPGKIEPQPAMAFFMIGAVHVGADDHGAQGRRNDGLGLDGVRPGGNAAESGGRAAPASAALPAVAAAHGAAAIVPAAAPRRGFSSRARYGWLRLRRPPRTILAPLASARARHADARRRASAGRPAHGRRRAPRHRQPLPRRARPRSWRSSNDPRLVACRASALLAAARARGPCRARDPRLVERLYNPDEVVRVEGRPSVQATIRFDEDEHIENVAIGDSTQVAGDPEQARRPAVREAAVASARRPT